MTLPLWSWTVTVNVLSLPSGRAFSAAGGSTVTRGSGRYLVFVILAEEVSFAFTATV